MTLIQEYAERLRVDLERCKADIKAAEFILNVHLVESFEGKEDDSPGYGAERLAWDEVAGRIMHIALPGQEGEDASGWRRPLQESPATTRLFWWTHLQGFVEDGLGVSLKEELESAKRASPFPSPEDVT